MADPGDRDLAWRGVNSGFPVRVSRSGHAGLVPAITGEDLDRALGTDARPDPRSRDLRSAYGGLLLEWRAR